MRLPLLLRTIALACALICGLASGTSAQSRPAPPDLPRVHEFREVHLGMEVRLLLVHRDETAARTLAERAFARIEALERIMSDHRPTSEVSRLSLAPVGRWTPVSRELHEVLRHAAFAAAATDGAFDHTVGPLTRLWREAARTGQPITDSARAIARRAVDYHSVEVDSEAFAVRFLRPDMRLDLGAIAKGWILDDVARSLDSSGVRSMLLEAGGEVVTRGAPPGESGWVIAVETSRGDTLLALTDAAVSTSASRAQLAPVAGGGHEGHVFRTTTGRGATDTPQLTVIGDRAWMTDAFATAFALMPPEKRRGLAERLQLRIVEP
jgi:FAD:protein FMN transferase